ncbi:hypothetical protein J3Q64DRAFT_1871485 [Phycomyces blakesleeanus]
MLWNRVLGACCLMHIMSGGYSVLQSNFLQDPSTCNSLITSTFILTQSQNTGLFLGVGSIAAGIMRCLTIWRLSDQELVASTSTSLLPLSNQPPKE